MDRIYHKNILRVKHKRWVELQFSKCKFWQLDSDELEISELRLRNSVALPLVVDDHHENDNGVLLKGTNILFIRAHNASAYVRHTFETLFSTCFSLIKKKTSAGCKQFDSR